MSHAPSSPPAAVYRLRGRIGDQETVVDLAVGTHRVGTLPSADLVLAAEGVSRRHALLTVTAAGLVVEDLGSKNGTSVDGRKVVRATLVEGGSVAFGPVAFVVRRVAGEDELAIRLPPTEPAASPCRLEEGSVAWADTPTEAPSPRPPEVGVWLAVLEDLLLRLSRPDGDLAGGIASLGEGLRLAGIVLVTWSGREEPLALAAWGTLAEVPPLARLRDHPSSSRERVRTLLFHTQPPVSVAIDLHAASPLALVLWGDFPGRRAADAFLRCALTALARALPPASSSASAPGSETTHLSFPPGFIDGRSPAMGELRRRLVALSSGRYPVLVHGETGAGKEVVALTLHASSPRARGPFVTINCAAIPDDLLDAEMFGVTRGAATGVEPREGHFGRAEGGTLFLDEIGELSTPLQAKLLRVLEEGEIQPVGGRPRPVDVWVIAATNVDPTSSGALRRDLYYRFSAGSVEVPPLRRRREDIPALVAGLLQRFASEEGVSLRGVTARALDRLCAYPWPGNVRELEHELHDLVRHDHGGVLDLDHLPARLRDVVRPDDEPPAAGESLELRPRVEALERALLGEAMRRAGGRQTVAARLLGVSRNGLAHMLKRLGLTRPP